MRIAMVASEVAPWSKTGGLGDVLGALPRALQAAGAEVVVFSPRYRQVDLPPSGGSLQTVVADGGVRYAFVEAPDLYDRDGIYGPVGEGGYAGDWPDNQTRFEHLARVAVSRAAEVVGGPVDLFHAHDWQAGAVPELAARSLFTIHNLAFRGPGRPSMLERGLLAADRVSTVSPTYAQEITTTSLGYGLEALLAQKGVVGVLNGIDTQTWAPGWSRRSWRAGKARVRRALVERFGLAWQPGELVLGCVSRLTHQKGIDLLIDALPSLKHVRLALLGTGDPALEASLDALARAAPGRVSVHLGFDEALARVVIEGADAFVMPSRFEPCGLAQLHAMRMGTVPIVHAVGGLADTVSDRVGVRFDRPEAEALVEAVARATRVFRADPAGWDAWVQAGMARDGSWAGAAEAYLSLYAGIVDARIEEGAC